MKYYNVTIINPINNRTERNLNVPATQLDIANNTFRFNSYHPTCPILVLEEITDEERNAENAYFAKYAN
jgi:hypothetical protein